MELVQNGNEFSPTEIRIIQSLWEKKAPEYIANMLDRPYPEVERKIKQMAYGRNIKLYQRPSFERKITDRSSREKKWADNQLQAKPTIRVRDDSGLISVRIDSKTIVRVLPGTDIEELKKKYSKRVFK